MITAKSYAKFLNIKKYIEIQEEIENRVNWLKIYLLESDMNGFVLGISGGVDSALVGFLAKRAVEELNQTFEKEYKLHLMHLPHGIQYDITDAYDVSRMLNGVIFNFNIKESVDSFLNNFPKNITDFNKGNLKSRVRMSALYLYASQHGLLVLGSDNAAEMISGFFTKFGDGGYDLNPIQSLSKRQVKELLRVFDVSEKLIEKTPTADLLDGEPGVSDEDVLGYTYEEIDDYIENWDREEFNEKIEEQFKKTLHKRILTPGV